MDKSQNKKNFSFSDHQTVKVGVLSDTHTHINPSVAEHLSDCDLIIHAGDIGSINVIQQLLKMTTDVVSVRGNNDTQEQWFAEEHKDLQNIPQIAEVELPGGNIVVTHGDEHFSDYDIWHEKLRNNFPTAKAIIYGHSHKLVIDTNAKPWVINPGAAGETRIQKHGVSCLRIDASMNEWNVIEFRV